MRSLLEPFARAGLRRCVKRVSSKRRHARTRLALTATARECGLRFDPGRHLAKLLREEQPLACVSVRDAERLVAGTAPEARRATAPSGSTETAVSPPWGEPDESPANR